jgi:hypothetical protein
MLGGQTQEIGERVVEIVATGNGRGCGREELAIGSVVMRSFAGH